MATCQICGREIKAKNGVIAHHGYTRPDQGYQTKSCFGARHLPYEESAEAIPLFIVELNRYIMHEQERFESIMRHPPEYLEKSEYTGREGRHMVKYNRPENFDPKVEKVSYSYMRDQYEMLFSTLKNSIQKNINSSQEYIFFLEQRQKNWQKQAQQTA